jgi:hypothetical protein
MKAKDWLILLIFLIAVLGGLSLVVAFVVGAIQCTAAGWDDGTWYVLDTLCENLTTETEKLSIIKAGE